MVEWREGRVMAAAWQGLLQEARRRPWLAGLLGRRGVQILKRFLSIIRQVMSLPRRLRRRLGAQARRALATSLVGAALLFALGQARPVQAATIEVDGVTCTLADAIEAANADAPVNGCAAGSGADTIELLTDVTLSSMLPPFASDIVLNGNGHTIDGAGVAPHVLYISEGALTLNEAVITGGNAVMFYGGGVYNYGGSVTINRSTITANSASFGGGGIANIYPYTMMVNNSTISANSAESGAGIYNMGALVVSNSTISNNTSAYGGGLLVSAGGTATLNRSIISGNVASSDGDEVYLHVREASITADNFNIFGFGGDAGGHNFVPGSSDIVPVGGLASVLDTTLADNGGLTPTHALAFGSPAIDRAPSADCDAAPVSGTDQRGFTRNTDGNASPSAVECDIGAFEFASGPTAIGLGAMQAQSAGWNGLLAAAGAGALAVGSAGYGLYRRVLRRPPDGETTDSGG